MADKPDADKSVAEEAPRKGRMQALAASLPGIAGKALGKRGLAEGGLVTDWTAIVGEQLARSTLPLKLAFAGRERRDGTLHLRVAGAIALELQHLEPQLIERINAYLGYGAVARLRLERGPLPQVARGRRLAEPSTAPLAPAESAAIDRSVEGIADEALRQSLARLGATLAREAKKPAGR
ncbi:MAG TPA: DciA family protein [Hypericibacter adhaerens]|uniref:DUF721 domain-containing protein n=1 Tax=Hypericibacter adhaerens TaxID=2602016 RepID=UPI002CFC0A5D|nr:DciA family protein [Hypericibacter adhaerens]HWA42638.1 DciA family protein [Hypericibacter adhaerens]